ncbi:MAG: RsmB/NOP family class I SAM-dependent RNA methyltransferase [Candidatus ainarchaeum sp.]|nr:RsmB/NOP family class I SAM-dependent RNA methyltransferase [Candidatus ainarchaeum sp.]
MINPKPLFEERMRRLLPEESDFADFSKKIHEYPLNFIRCNTLKISPDELRQKLEEKNWKISQPFSGRQEIMLIESKLLPGEIGKAIEHLLGYYYVQEVSSMMPAFALEPKPGEFVLDLCASPGSKTTQIAALMENSGAIIANDRAVDRIISLCSNLERCAVGNTIVTKEDAIFLCQEMGSINLEFDKILVDVPCSGEGNIRSNPKTLITWSIGAIRQLSDLQKKIAISASALLKKGGTMVYSTCTHAPEENEEVVSYLAQKKGLVIEKASLPLKSRHGIKEWGKSSFVEGIENACRIYPQDNDCEGFFVAKLKKE